MGLHVKVAVASAREFEWEGEIAPFLNNSRCVVLKEPIGVVGAITPWNWPLNQIACKLAPALLTGCTVVLKPSEVAPLNAVLVAEALHAAALPAGVVNVVFGAGAGCGEVLATSAKVDMVSFTGSTPVGKTLQALGAGTVKRVRTELGGKSAAVILPDATAPQIVEMASHVVGNTGQSCNALSRLLVPRRRLAEVEELAKGAFEKRRVVESTDTEAKMSCIGPLASAAQHEKVRRFIRAGIDEGAKLVTGGLEHPEGVPAGGYFVRPTVFSEVTPAMAIATEEIFGPVLSILPYDSVEEAVAIANDTVFGLNNGVAGADVDAAMAVARQLRSGQVHVNTTAGNPKSPFGGYKQSGDGREWGSYGLEEFLQTKAINVPAAE